MMNAIRRTIESHGDHGGLDGTGANSVHDQDGHDGEEDTLQGPVVVEQVDLARAIANLKPSVSERELAHYESLHAQFQVKRQSDT